MEAAVAGSGSGLARVPSETSVGHLTGEVTQGKALRVRTEATDLGVSNTQVPAVKALAGVKLRTRMGPC